MMMQLQNLFLLCVFAVCGCGGVSVSPNPEPVDVTFNVTAGGKPVSDVKFNFQPTGDGLPAVVDVKDGSFQWKVTPGKYTWFISPGSKEAAFAAVPAQYHEGALDRQFEISGGESMEFKLD